MSTKRCFAVSEFANVVRAGATTISGEPLLCGDLGYGLRLVSQLGGVRHVPLFGTGPERGIFIGNWANLAIAMSEIECIAVGHGHRDHMAALPAAIIATNDGMAWWSSARAAFAARSDWD
jgi:7,8-dihydropterin-6-yl-methyl-4-(beta-D-ribofuranosyl)aminobenzene 5'-phosphate synthase